MLKSSLHALRILFWGLIVLGGVSRSCFAQATKLHNAAITPLTLTLTSNDPDAGVVNGSGTAVVSFRTTTGQPTRTWTLRVSAAGTTFTGCPSPVSTSLVRLTCTSATVDAPGTGACAAPITLTTTPQLMASGNEDGKAGTAYVINFNVDIVFADAWNYIPTTTACSANLNYEIVAN